MKKPFLLGLGCGCILPLLLVLFVYEYWTISMYFDRYKRYYIPQVDLYLTLYRPPHSSDGYILLSRNDSSCFSDSVDYIKLIKNETSGIDLIFNSLDSNSVVISGWWDESEMHPIYLKMKKAAKPDTLFFKQKGVGSKSRESYIRVYIDGYLGSVTLWQADAEGYTLVPID